MNLKHYLLIFQLEGYRIPRFLRWVFKHYAQAEIQENKEPVWTTKAKQLYWLALILFICGALYCIKQCLLPYAIVVITFLWLNSYIFLVLALLLLKPYELINRLRVKYLIYKKIHDLKQKHHLTVIGITGSFGKTSTKMVLGQLLTKTLITAKSYNTLFGIFKVIDYELNKRYRSFVCEMGAYKRGDVKEFCQLVSPDIGVLTGINEQHLERFGSIENTIEAKFEILTNLVPKGTGVVNLDNQLVRENLHRFIDYLQEKNIKVIGYTVEGQNSPHCKEILAIKNWKIENGKSVFEFDNDGQTYKVITALLGKGHLSNILAAIAVSLAVGENISEVIERVGKLKQIPHRLELRINPSIFILDNTYSSNPSGFREALDVLRLFNQENSKSAPRKILITPGIVELGEKALEIHRELGTLAAKICDEIVLVGNSNTIEAMHEGVLSAGFTADKISRLPGRGKVQEFLRNQTHLPAVILMENDLPDQYL